MKKIILLALVLVLLVGCCGVPKEYKEAGSEFFSVYDKNEDTYEINIAFYISINKKLPLLEKLKVIADKLSRYRFRFLPIEITRLEWEADKAIAVINLGEHKWNRKINWGKERPSGESWRQGYFQGSTKGAMTTCALIDTFLQPEYTGEWVDGIRFNYEGEPAGEWDHVYLSGTIYRNEEGENK